MRLKNFLAGLVLASCGVQVASATTYSLNILITGYGTGYYQLGDSTATNTTWLPFASTQTEWDSQVTTPGGTTSINNTAFFKLSEISGVTGWTANTGNDTGGSEGALILTSPGTPSSSSAVQNLLVLDGNGSGNGIYMYNAPTALNPINQSSPVNSYGYISHYAGSSTPINQLGTNSDSTTTDTGLYGDLENNNTANSGGFAGNVSASGYGDGTNISAGGEQYVNVATTDSQGVAGLPANLDNIFGYEFGGSSAPLDVTYDGATITPTIYVAAVPLPNSATTLAALLAMVGSLGFWNSIKGRSLIVG